MDFAQLISSGPDGLRGSLPEVPISPHETAIRNIDNRGSHTDRNGQLNRNGSPIIVNTRGSFHGGYNLSLSRFVLGQSIRHRPPENGTQQSRFAGVERAWWYNAVLRS